MRHAATALKPSATVKRDEILWEMLAIYGIDGFLADDDFLASMEPLVSGQMTPEEHREFLFKKYGEAA